jgi:aspartate ammonia-lyase
MDISRVTALNPVIGYENAAKIARKAYLTGKSVREIALEEGVVDGKEIDRYLDPERMV